VGGHAVVVDVVVRAGISLHPDVRGDGVRVGLRFGPVGTGAGGSQT
jgi:hypothetical protein